MYITQKKRTVGGHAEVGRSFRHAVSYSVEEMRQLKDRELADRQLADREITERDVSFQH